MWSVWSERVDLYLGQGLAMLKMKRHGERVVRLAPTLPMDRVLSQLAQELAQIRPTNRYACRNLHITLSAALCPTSGFTVPQTVLRWDERQSIACASAAATVGTQVGNIICEADRDHAGVAASIGSPLFDDLTRWAAENHCRLVSVQPLWAAASQCQLVLSAAIKGILLQEPDAVTVVAVGQDGRPLASTLTGHSGQPGSAMQVRRWLVGSGLSQSDVLRLDFAADLLPPLNQGPGTWLGHWALAPEIS